MANAPRRRKKADPPQTLFKLGLGAQTNPQAYEQARRRKYRDLFDTLLGREVLADILSTLGYFAQDPPTERDLANFRNGVRWGACEILRAMGVDNADALTRAVLDDNLNEGFNDES